MKKILTLALAANLSAGSLAYASEKSGFRDISGKEWYCDAVVRLSERGLISGYSDGTFRADRKLTYAEFITLLDRLYFGSSKSSEGLWYKDAFDRFLDCKVLTERDGIYEKAHSLITREETAVILSRSLEKIKNIPPDYRERRFSDFTDISFEKADYVCSMANLGILKGDESGRFLPGETLTRAQAAMIISNTEEFLKRSQSNISANALAADSFIKTWTENNIDQSMTDEEKARKIHDFIVERNRYNTEDLQAGRNTDACGYNIYEPESVLFGNGGVCDAYAKLFELMARKAGLDAKYVAGISVSSKGNSTHAWNMVKIDGSWYHIDTTWDDPVGRDDVLYLFYLRGDGFMKGKRIWFEEGNPPAYSDYSTDRTATVEGVKTLEENVRFEDGMIMFY